MQPQPRTYIHLALPWRGIKVVLPLPAGTSSRRRLFTRGDQAISLYVTSHVGSRPLAPALEEQDSPDIVLVRPNIAFQTAVGC